MAAVGAVFYSDSWDPERITLKKRVTAFEVLSEHGSGKDGLSFGLTRELPEGCEVSICGAGMTEKTVQVVADGLRYCVLRASLFADRVSGSKAGLR